MHSVCRALLALARVGDPGCPARRLILAVQGRDRLASVDHFSILDHAGPTVDRQHHRRWGASASDGPMRDRRRPGAGGWAVKGSGGLRGQDGISRSGCSVVGTDARVERGQGQGVCARPRPCRCARAHAHLYKRQRTRHGQDLDPSPHPHRPASRRGLAAADAIDRPRQARRVYGRALGVCAARLGERAGGSDGRYRSGQGHGTGVRLDPGTTHQPARQRQA